MNHRKELSSGTSWCNLGSQEYRWVDSLTRLSGVGVSVWTRAW